MEAGAMQTTSDLYETELEVIDGAWMAKCAEYPCDGFVIAPSGSVIWGRDDFDAADDNEGIQATCASCADPSKVIVGSNRYPCVICFNTVKVREGYRCDTCGVPLCGGNACGGAHDSHCKTA
jgi:rRNA maturation endonuclease Nob1